MVIQPTYGNGVIENPTIEISQESLRSILSEIEAELVNSEVYQRTIAGLQTMLGEASSTAQILVKAVGREAVRLTFQQFAKQYKVVPVPSEETNQAKHTKSDSSQGLKDNPDKTESRVSATSIEEVTSSGKTTKQRSFKSKARSETKPSKKLTPELAAQAIAQQRQELLRQVGQELRQAREARSLSLLQLHNQTLVPIHHIEALESGCLDHLPEDVYICGFIRRLGHALGLNGIAMADSLPSPDPVKSVVPSWYHPTGTSVGGFQLSSLHLYLGYTALIAGAVGGLSLMSNKTTPEASVKPEPPAPSKASVSPKAEPTKPISKPGIKASKTGIKAGTDIAPPERFTN